MKTNPKKIDRWFSIYALSHQNPTNKKIHYVCVPLIFYSTLAILEGISRAEFLNLPFSLSLALVGLGGIFYIQLRSMLAIGGLILALASWYSFGWITSETLVYGGAIVFIVAWIGQFVGHKIEGAKPSFLQDLVFLLIGPLWVLKALKDKAR
jgi:uncharacterized membrane protein YGL010W